MIYCIINTKNIKIPVIDSVNIDWNVVHNSRNIMETICQLDINGKIEGRLVTDNLFEVTCDQCLLHLVDKAKRRKIAMKHIKKEFEEFLHNRPSIRTLKDDT